MDTNLAKLALDGADGRYWYDYAKAQIEAAARHYGIDPKRFADLLSLFSPRVSVKRSIRFAIRYARTGEFEHDVTRNTKAAVAHYDLTGEIRGAKTEPFARALMGDKTAVVFDTWMADAMGVDGSKFAVKRVHRVQTERLIRVAEYLGWPIAETQAAIWTGIVKKSRRSVPQLEIPLD